LILKQCKGKYKNAGKNKAKLEVN